MDTKELRKLFCSRMKNYLLFFSLLLALFASKPIYSTHLIGGNLGYEYIGQLPTGEYSYKIILTTYTNCGPGSNIPEPEGPTLTVGVYQHDIQNSPLEV